MYRLSYCDPKGQASNRYSYTIAEMGVIIKMLRTKGLTDYYLSYSLKFLKNLCNS